MESSPFKSNRGLCDVSVGTMKKVVKVGCGEHIVCCVDKQVDFGWVRILRK